MEHLDYIGAPELDIDPDVVPVRAKLKWFNVPKGFGFVVVDGEDVDAFLHITILQSANMQIPGEGTTMLCVIDRGQRGAHVRQVLQVFEVDLGDMATGLTVSDLEDVVLEGLVKWYRPEKGFGFVTADDGNKDVFVHKACLDRHGVLTLAPGQRVRVGVRLVPKGREATSIEVVAIGATA